jgi:hypothetical protein
MRTPTTYDKEGVSINMFYGCTRKFRDGSKAANAKNVVPVGEY